MAQGIGDLQRLVALHVYMFDGADEPETLLRVARSLVDVLRPFAALTTTLEDHPEAEHADSEHILVA